MGVRGDEADAVGAAVADGRWPDAGEAAGRDRRGERARGPHAAGAAVDDDYLLRMGAVATWLDVSTTTVYELLRGARPLPARRIGNGWRVRVGDLRAWIRQAPRIGE